MPIAKTYTIRVEHVEGNLVKLQRADEVDDGRYLLESFAVSGLSSGGAPAVVEVKGQTFSAPASGECVFRLTRLGPLATAADAP